LQPKGTIGQTQNENTEPRAFLLALLSLSATNSFSQNKETDSSILYKTGEPVD
jgi:hypothetical protein